MKSPDSPRAALDDGRAVAVSAVRFLLHSEDKDLPIVMILATDYKAQNEKEQKSYKTIRAVVQHSTRVGIHDAVDLIMPSRRSVRLMMLTWRVLSARTTGYCTKPLPASTWMHTS
jgi:hypothetical protein